MSKPENLTPKRKTTRTSATQIRDFACAGFQTIEQIVMVALERPDPSDFLRIIGDLAHNFNESLQ